MHVEPTMLDFTNTVHNITVDSVTFAGIIAESRLPRISSVNQVLLDNWSEYFFFLGSALLAYVLWKKTHYLTASVFLALGVAWVAFHAPVVDWLNSLGTDSFAETTTFDLHEAKFWLGTLRETLDPTVNPKVLVFYGLLAMMLVLVLTWVNRMLFRSYGSQPYVFIFVALVFIGGAAKGTVSGSLVEFFDNSQWYSEAQTNFDTPLPVLEDDPSPLNVVIYIGESISALNMGLYGYPRDTTPELSALAATDPNLLVFHNVFSTHTHTTQSLLEALSLGISAEESYLPINRRKRVSLADILLGHGIPVTLVSNQGQTGLWNLTASIVFGRSHQIFSSDTRLLGNMEHSHERPWDHEFFGENLSPLLASAGEGPNVIFLHSYAGHGPYLRFIPESFREPVDRSFQDRDFRASVGSSLNRLPEVEEYDSAVRYVDYSVAQSLRLLKRSPKPGVFVFLSDHGEAPYLRLGHDSSRFVHEMARVPFVIYFNEAARREHSHVYEKYINLAAAKRVSTLAQLPETLLDLLGMRLPHGHDGGLRLGVVGEAVEVPPILVRDTVDGLVHVSLGHDSSTPKSAVGWTREVADEATQIFVAARNEGNKARMVCYHGSNTIGTAVRGRLIANCLEVDLNIQTGGRLAIHDKERDDIGVEFGEIAAIAESNDLALWINAWNLTSSENCTPLLKRIKENGAWAHPILIEFSAPMADIGRLESCVSQLSTLGHLASYRLPKELVRGCVDSMGQGDAVEQSQHCRALAAHIESVHNRGIFSGITFDVSGLAAIGHVAVARELTWNVRGVSVSDLSRTATEKVKRVSVVNSDRNAVR
jgi:glucan phosphoethanolaminetransferase (alkaline phosphatase superfamily)